MHGGRLSVAMVGVIALIVVSLAGMIASPRSSADQTYLGSCVNDRTIDASRIVFACTQILANCAMTIHAADCNLVLYYRGLAEERLENHEAAVRDFGFSIRLDPSFPGVWVALGELSEKLGQVDPTMSMLDAMVSAHPNSTQVLNRACYIRAVRNRQLDVAQKDCDDALRTTPDDPYTLDSRCLLRFRQGEFANAVGDCDAALKRSAELPTSLYVRGLAKIRLGYIELGNADIAAATRLDAKIADTFAGYGVKP